MIFFPTEILRVRRLCSWLRPTALRRTMGAAMAATTLTTLPTRAADVLPGFTTIRMCEGLTGATALAPLPDGRILIAEQTGAVRMLKENQLLNPPAITLPTDSTWERGVLGLALAPGFPSPPHVFVHWTVAQPGPHLRLSRFTLVGDTLDPASELILLEGSNQNEIRASMPAGHQGGGLAIGPDGCLYAAVGEMTTQTPSQQLNSLLGKILRLRTDGSIPEDNPFFAQTTGTHRAIWALGLRNPWSLAFHPTSGRLFANDIGQASFEEINEIVRGGNYGWPEAEGRVEKPKFRDPLLDYGRTIGASLGGGCFYHTRPDAAHAFPSEWNGRYLAMDFMAGWLAWVDETATPHPALRAVARNLAKPIAVAVDPEGALLVLERNTWLKDAKFKAGQGWLTKIIPSTDQPGAGPPVASAPPPAPAAAPAPAATVSTAGTTWPSQWQQGNLERGSIAYAPLVEPWRPGVTVERKVVVPAGEKLSLTPDGDEFVLPADTLIITHAAVAGRRVQTTVVRARPNAPHWAAVYRWQEDGQEATLVREALAATVAGQPWFFSGPTDQLILPVTIPGYDCELRPINLPPTSPLTPIIAPHAATVPRLTAMDAPGAAPENIIRSFLDVNCASCHRPGGAGRGLYDARATTPLAEQQLINGPLLSGELGVPGAKVIVPGHPEKSMLYLRLKKPPGDPMRMPPGCSSPATPPIVPILETWIRQLP